jgi:hypothetical protein
VDRPPATDRDARVAPARAATRFGVSALGRLLGSALCAVLAAPAAGATAGVDTIGVRLENGVGLEVTNEQYYEDAFVDTTFLGRRLRGTPETRLASVVALAVEGTRADRGTSYALRHDLTLGNRLLRGAAGLDWRQELGPDWRVDLAPAIDYRHDRTFDRDREEWRGSFGARLRRSLNERRTRAELGGFADFIRSSGEGDAFLLDRNTGRIGAALDHLPWSGPEWRIEYRLSGREFPDSTERDHFEHGWDGRIRQGFDRGWVALETEGILRRPIREVPSSRDDYGEATIAGEAEWRLSDATALRLRAEVASLRYGTQDSVLFFDYDVVRARAGWRREWGAASSWTVGPRLERLTSEWSPGEGYLEVGGTVELEAVGRRSWWSIEPAAGWREYDDVRDAIVAGEPRLHSSYAFYEVSAFVDQPLPERLRIRALAMFRSELHDDSSQDAFSTYVSLQLRWIAF